MSAGADYRAALADKAAGLGDDELRVLCWIADRLCVGQRQYGRLDIVHDPRDWRRERSEEIADALVYSAIDDLKKGGA